MTETRFTEEQEIFVVQFSFGVLANDDLYKQPLLANFKVPERIYFNRLTKPIVKTFCETDPQFLPGFSFTDENGYEFYNQYPGPREDITVAEGLLRFNLGVDYKWYQTKFSNLKRKVRYEYMDLIACVERIMRGVIHYTKILENPELTVDEVKNAKKKGMLLLDLCERISHEFKGTYPGYSLAIKTDPSIQVVIVTPEVNPGPV